MKKLALLTVFIMLICCSTALAATDDNKALVTGLINKILATAPQLSADQVMVALASTLDSLGINTTGMDMSGGINGIAAQMGTAPATQSLLNVLVQQGISTTELSEAATALGISKNSSGKKKKEEDRQFSSTGFTGDRSSESNKAGRADSGTGNEGRGNNNQSDFDTDVFSVDIEDIIDDAIDLANDSASQGNPAGGNDDTIDSGNSHPYGPHGNPASGI